MRTTTKTTRRSRALQLRDRWFGDHAALLTVHDLLDRPVWQADGACREHGLVAFFALPFAQARTVCAGCPVRVECATFALEHEDVGVWGGTTADERDHARAAGWDASTLLELAGTLTLSESAATMVCDLCGLPCHHVDRRGRCETCERRAKRQALERARTFAADQARRRERGGRLKPAWSLT
jgi:WhiB family redox-sensing transcriptional regulator